MTLLSVLLILLFSILLIKAADLLVVAIRRLARVTGLSSFAVSAVILAMGTSFPELFVGVTAALEGSPALSLGNVLGANIANLTLVLGGAALIFGSVGVHGAFLRREVFIAFFAGLAPIFLILDRSLSRVDGLILIALYGLYAASLFRERFEAIAKEYQEEGFWYRFLRRVRDTEGELGRELGRLFLGLALLLFSADVIVRLAKILASQAGIPILVVGLIVLSIGTTLPELAFSFRALLSHSPTIVFGNLLGSIITNSTLVIGLVATIRPITVVARREYLLATIAFFLAYLLFWFFIRTKHRLDRWEAAALFVLYLTFALLAFS